MKKLILLLVSIVMIIMLASCGDPEIVGYHIDENGKLIATYDDDTTVDLGILTDTIANGVKLLRLTMTAITLSMVLFQKLKQSCPNHIQSIPMDI